MSPVSIKKWTEELKEGILRRTHANELPVMPLLGYATKWQNGERKSCES
jgi:hypothetical protein